MTILENTFEGGTNGVTITAGTSGGASGDAFTGVIGSPIWSNAQVAHGTLAGVISNGGSDAISQEFRWASSLNAAQCALRAYFRFTSVAPSEAVYCLTARNSGGSVISSVSLEPGGNLVARNNFSNIGGSASSALSVDTWYRIELLVTVAGGGNDRVQYAYYLGDSTTPVQTPYDSGATLTFTNAGNIDQIRIGKGNTATWTGPCYIDSIKIDTTASSFIGPVSTPLDTPVVTVTAETDPSSFGGSDGSITVTWPAVSGAATYEAGIASGHDQTSFSIDSAAATSPYTFTGLSDGLYTVAVRANP